MIVKVDVPEDWRVMDMLGIFEEAIKRLQTLPDNREYPPAWALVLASIAGKVSWSAYELLCYEHIDNPAQDYRDNLVILVTQAMHAIHDYDTQIEERINELQQANPEGMGDDSEER